MYKKKVFTYITLGAMVAIFAGILFYMSYVKKSESQYDGTFVNAFSQNTKEYCL